LGLFRPVISSVTVEEIQGAPQNVMAFFKKVEATAEIITLSEDVVELSNVYLKEGKFSPQLRVDTLHIAVATVNHVELIASWNFKHIVNLDRIRIYNAVNLKMGYPVVEIRKPEEIIHEIKNSIQWRFQRKRREALSRRICKMTPSQMVMLFNGKIKVNRSLRQTNHGPPHKFHGTR